VDMKHHVFSCWRKVKGAVWQQCHCTCNHSAHFDMYVPVPASLQPCSVRLAATARRPVHHWPLVQSVAEGSLLVLLVALGELHCLQDVGLHVVHKHIIDGGSVWHCNKRPVAAAAAAAGRTCTQSTASKQ
jgi:hypothetical protein